MAYSKGDDVQLPYTGGLTPGRRLLLTSGEFEVLDNDESLLIPPDKVSTARADNYRRVVASPSSIQLARDRPRLRRSFEETEAVNRVDSVMASRNRFQARTGGSESVIVIGMLRCALAVNYVRSATWYRPPARSNHWYGRSICKSALCYQDSTSKQRAGRSSDTLGTSPPVGAERSHTVDL